MRSGHPLLTQLLIGGEFPVYIDGFGSTIEKFRAQEAPIDWVPLEPVIVSLNPVGLAVNAPHPASARLLIDFLLSKEGQEVGRTVGKLPARVDVEAPYPRLTKGLKLFPVPLAVAERYGEIVKEFRELFLKVTRSGHLVERSRANGYGLKGKVRPDHGSNSQSRQGYRAGVCRRRGKSLALHPQKYGPAWGHRAARRRSRQQSPHQTMRRHRRSSGLRFAAKRA